MAIKLQNYQLTIVIISKKSVRFGGKIKLTKIKNIAEQNDNIEKY